MPRFEWFKPSKCMLVGFTYQRYGFGAWCFQLYLFNLKIEWHKR